MATSLPLPSASKTKIPASPDELASALTLIFPAFQVEEPRNDPEQVANLATFHSVMFAFTPFFGKSAASCSERQLRSFGALLNDAVREPGPVENAISTCFLEHLRQIHAEKVLRPFVGPLVKERTHA
jgi:hypothetical protein